MKVALITLVIILSILGANRIWITYRTRRIAQHRKGMTQDQFADVLHAKGIPETISKAVFRGFQRWASAVVTDFPVEPADKIIFFDPITEFDYEDIVDDILDEVGKYWPKEKLLPHSKNMTVEDVARFIMNCENRGNSRGIGGSETAIKLGAQKFSPPWVPFKRRKCK